jgi:hypothetical protein
MIIQCPHCESTNFKIEVWERKERITSIFYMECSKCERGFELHSYKPKSDFPYMFSKHVKTSNILIRQKEECKPSKNNFYETKLDPKDKDFIDMCMHKYNPEMCKKCKINVKRGEK